MTTFYYCTLYVQPFKAVNRFCAIYSPVRYRRWFSDDHSKYLIVIVLFLSCLNGSLYFFPGCNFYFDGNHFTWMYEETSCYDIMAVYTDLIMGCSIVGTTILIDISTLILIMKNNLLNGKNNKEVKFFIQAFSTSLLYTTMLIISQGIYNLNNDKWYVFMTVTFSWEMCHAIDG